MNLLALQQLKERGEKIAVLTSYDASFAALSDKAGVDVLLVGDSLGMTIQGHTSTLPVSLRDMEYHTRCVAQGVQQAFIVTDMPFGSYQINPEQAFENAALLMAAGAQMVKVEGGSIMLDTVRFLVERGIPVCGHLGLTPQSVHQFGGYRVQARDEAAARQLLEDAKALAAAGAGMLVLEMVPTALAAAVSQAIKTPVIGIGAGKYCDGQVLVLQDMLGIYAGKSPRFVRNFMQGATSIEQAISDYVAAVKAQTFPDTEHSFE